jgi:hypothetical protein
MIDQVDNELKGWIDTVLNGKVASLAPPSASQVGRGVSVYLLDLVNTPVQREAKRSWLEISLRYLITTWAEDPLEAHRLLGELLFAGMEHAGYEVEQTYVPVDLWRAFNVQPRPGFFLRVPMRKTLPERKAKPVRKLVAEVSPTKAVYGTVLGPDDIPLSGALVEMPALNLSTRSDHKGQFQFAMVPAESRAGLLRVRAKGRELAISAAELRWGDEPVIIRFERMED